jgi:hypothetical protein
MRKLLYLFSFFLLTIFACEDIVEDDLSKKSVILLAPPNEFHTTITSNTFWWEVVDGCTGYNLQIVSPSFDYIERLFLDTNIVINKWDFSLLPGEYEWRVRAYNNTTTTLFTTYSIIIDSTIDISQEIIQLLTPNDMDTSNIPLNQFKWALLYNADDYNFQLYFEGVKYFTKTTVNDTVIKSLNEGDGLYKWEVRGQNAFSNTAYSSRTIFIDTTPPAKPVLIEPANLATLPDSLIYFEWNHEITTGSSIKDSLYIATDLLMNNLIRSIFLAYPNYEDSLGPGDYFWKVRSLDKAGNKSVYSDIRKFTIIEKGIIR